MPESQPAAQEEQRGQQFNQKVTNRNWGPAIAAFATQVNPRKQRDVEIPWNGVLAMRAMGGRRNNTLAERHPVDANVEETSYHRAEHEDHDRPKMERDCMPVLGVEDGIKHKRFSRARGA